MSDIKNKQTNKNLYVRHHYSFIFQLIVHSNLYVTIQAKGYTKTIYTQEILSLHPLKLR